MPLVSTILASTVMISTLQPVQAYVPTDYASETVQQTLQALKDASGNTEATFKVYENIAGIITEGKGVGGMVNYSKCMMGDVVMCLWVEGIRLGRVDVGMTSKELVH